MQGLGPMPGKRAAVAIISPELSMHGRQDRAIARVRKAASKPINVSFLQIFLFLI
jgi:hypothetical protein